MGDAHGYRILPFQGVLVRLRAVGGTLSRSKDGTLWVVQRASGSIAVVVNARAIPISIKTT